MYAIVPFGGANALNQDGKRDPIDSSPVTYIASYYWGVTTRRYASGCKYGDQIFVPLLQLGAGVILLGITGNDFQILPAGKPNIYAAIRTTDE